MMRWSCIPPPPGRYGISDGRRTAVLDTHTSAQRAAYERYFTRQHQAVDELLRACAVPLIRLATTDDVVERLRGNLGDGGLPTAGSVGVAA
jgi:hypothetical protein